MGGPGACVGVEDSTAAAATAAGIRGDIVAYYRCMYLGSCFTKERK